MPSLRTNYIKKWNANRKIKGGQGGYASTALSGAGTVGKAFLGPVNFSINAYTDASGVAIVSVKTVLSIFGNPSSQATRLEPLIIEPLSFSTYSFSGAKGPDQRNPNKLGWSFDMFVTSMWASGSLAVFTPMFESAAGSSVTAAGSAAAICRMTAMVCSGPPG